jgi:hypothetical protein
MPDETHTMAPADSYAVSQSSILHIQADDSCLGHFAFVAFMTVYFTTVNIVYKSSRGTDNEKVDNTKNSGIHTFYHIEHGPILDVH